MRFILNFFFFGLLFYLIYLFFPEAFHTLVSWADRTVEFLKEVGMRISDWFYGDRSQAAQHTAAFLPFIWKNK